MCKFVSQFVRNTCVVKTVTRNEISNLQKLAKVSKQHIAIILFQNPISHKAHEDKHNIYKNIQCNKYLDVIYVKNSEYNKSTILGNNI